jgi:hypothetical protein
MEKAFMKKAVSAILWALIVVAIFGASIGAVYAFVLPKFFPGPGWGTYSPLILGIIVATLIGGYIGYRVPATDKLSIKVSCGFCYAAAVAGLVSYVSLFIILNTRGS